ncbi:leucine-rich repeat-containing protein 23-like [Maniola hyperantus]|uniref:leucine-rich repeat-containing protein 23-like n=1 Tax=Aphantopus hyperantus TaxID=2795564 RepID=UPI0015698112|nr:leucine-rich repeat-containing protein 23-like [Maniola hyperantus]
MLKSHFNIAKQGDIDLEEESEHVPEEAPGETHEVMEEEPEEYVQKTFSSERRLNRSEVSVRLSLLGKTAEGDGYTYLKASCTGMNLTNISAIKSFQHLQFLDVSNNSLDLESLQEVTKLPFLVLIHADKNLLNSAALKKMKYMQVMIMNNNSITSVHDVYQPELCTLEVGYNKIKKIQFDYKMPNIKCLDFRYNLIQDIPDFDFPNLDSLYLAGNSITSLVGIEKLVNLRILHVRNNPIKILNGFDPGLKKLQYLNLRNCGVASLKQVKKLRVLPALETLVLKGCPYMGGMGQEDQDVEGEEDDAELRVEILAALPRLKRLNKGVFTPEERAEAKELLKQWIEEGEKDEEELVEEQQEETAN